MKQSLDKKMYHSQANFIYASALDFSGNIPE